MIAYSLPTQSTAFVGRHKELRDILARFEDSSCRLLTLVGPGGIGKTRVALEMARLIIDADGDSLSDMPDYPDGVYFIPLQSLNSPDLIVSAIAEAACFQFYQGSDLKGQLMDYLENKSMLLVLDNLEHLLEGVDLVSDILANAPSVKVLATSREALNLQEEWLYPIMGMSVPDENHSNGLEHYSAIQLFIQSAQRVQPGFQADVERENIIHICRMVGGMPLGIELAAAWVRALSCSEIADEIERGLDILETPARNVPERHRNMRAVLDQSWYLLDEDEQCIMRWLSVFWGGFTREAAEAVGGALAKNLLALVDKSWLRRDALTGRYDFHELLRQYAYERLLESEDSHTALKLHTEYFANFMQAKEREITYRRQRLALREIEQDFSNVRVAWKHAAEGHNHHALNKMAEAMSLFCDMRARFVEGEELFRQAGEHLVGLDDPVLHHTNNRLWGRRLRMILLGSLESHFNPETIQDDSEQIADENRHYDDPAELAFSIRLAGIAKHECGSLSKVVRPYFAESLAIYESLHMLYDIGEGLVWLGLNISMGESAKPYLQRALDIQRQIGDENGIGWSLMHLARIAFYQRDFADSERYSDEAMALQRERGDVKGLYWTVMFNCEWRMHKGDFERAWELAEECNRISLTLKLTAYRRHALITRAQILIITETDYDEGMRLCRESLSLEAPFSFSSPTLDAHVCLAMASYYKGDIEALRSHYDYIKQEIPDHWELAYQLSTVAPIFILLLDTDNHIEQAVEVTARVLSLYGETDKPVMTWLDSWAILSRLREKWQSALGKEAYDSLWERGMRQDVQALYDLSKIYPEVRVISTQALAEESPTPGGDITEREMEVLRLLSRGLSNREIARELVLALGTVKWYISEIYSKLGVGSRTQAIVRARELKLVS